jgi:hypothetical protein
MVLGPSIALEAMLNCTGNKLGPSIARDRARTLYGVRNRVGLPLRARTLQFHSKFHRCNVKSASGRVFIPEATRRAKQGCWWVGLSGAGSRHYQQMLTLPPRRWQYSFLRGPTPGSFRLRSVRPLYDSFPYWRSKLSGIHNILDVAGHCKRHAAIRY